MILIAGGTGTLGAEIVRLLTARGLNVRVLTRDPERAKRLEGPHVDTMAGDVGSPESVASAVDGVDTVISAMHGFAGIDAAGPRAVDGRGNSNLIAAAEAAGVKHFVLVSIHDASPEHPMELFRMKALAEQELKATALASTIIRPTAYMETWARLIGEPLLKTGKTWLFGRGMNPINFVSAHDVARFIDRSVVDPAMHGEAVDVGGPENLSMKQVIQIFEMVTGHSGNVSHVPLPVMRAMAVLMRPVNPVLARQIQAGVIMDTTDMSFDPAMLRRCYPDIPLTSLANVVRRDYLSQSATPSTGA